MDENKVEGDAVGSRSIMERWEVNMIARELGLGAMVLDLGQADLTRGSMRVSERSRCFWLNDGRRVTVSLVGDGGIIGSVSNEPDPELPPPLEV